MICLWQRTLKLQRFGSSCLWAFHFFAMDSKELSSISDCFGDQITIKNTKTYTIWLETIAKVLNMLIGLKGNNYYSKVFKRVNYKLSNSPFWVVIRNLQGLCGLRWRISRHPSKVGSLPRSTTRWRGGKGSSGPFHVGNGRWALAPYSTGARSATLWSEMRGAGCQMERDEVIVWRYEVIR